MIPENKAIKIPTTNQNTLLLNDNFLIEYQFKIVKGNK